MKTQEMDLRGKVLWISGRDVNRRVLSNLRQLVKASGGLGVIWMSDESEVSSKTIDQAIKQLEELKERQNEQA